MARSYNRVPAGSSKGGEFAKGGAFGKGSTQGTKKISEGIFGRIMAQSGRGIVQATYKTVKGKTTTHIPKHLRPEKGTTAAIYLTPSRVIYQRKK